MGDLKFVYPVLVAAGLLPVALEVFKSTVSSPTPSSLVAEAQSWTAATDPKLPAVVQFAAQLGRGPTSRSASLDNDAIMLETTVAQWNPYSQLVTIEQSVSSTWDQPQDLTAPIGKLEQLRNDLASSAQLHALLGQTVDRLVEYRTLVPKINRVNDILSQARKFVDGKRLIELQALQKTFLLAIGDFNESERKFMRRQETEGVQLWAQFGYQLKVNKAIDQAVAAARSRNSTEIASVKASIEQLLSAPATSDADQLLKQRLIRIKSLLDRPSTNTGDALLLLFVTKDLLQDRGGIRDTLGQIVKNHLDAVMSGKIILVSSKATKDWKPSDPFPNDGDLVPFDDQVPLAKMFEMGLDAVKDMQIAFKKPPQCIFFVWTSLMKPEYYPGPPDVPLALPPADRVVCYWLGTSEKRSAFLNRWFDRDQGSTKRGYVATFRSDEMAELQSNLDFELGEL